MPRVKEGKIFTPSSDKSTLALPPERYFRGKSNQFSKMGLLDRMDEALSTEQWKLLKESRFGGIIMIEHNVPYCCALIHFFLERQLKTLKKGETWYEIQGRLLRFSMKEFCIVTGLNCARRVRDFEAEDHKDALKRFFDRGKVKVKDLIVTWDMEFVELDDAFIQHYRYMLAAKVFSHCHPTASTPPPIEPTSSTTS